jgi:hypothetical protein
VPAPDRAASRPAVPGRQGGRATVRRAGAGVAAAAAAVLMLAGAGCTKFDAALGRQWAIVHFKTDTTVSTVLQVRTACSHVPNARPQPLPKKRTGLSMIYAVQYTTTNASDANLAQLQRCLQKFPSVAGIEFQDSGDS